MIRLALTLLVLLFVVHFTKEHILKTVGKNAVYELAYKIQAWTGLLFFGTLIAAIWWP